jgi:hypothetical protein
VPRNPGLKDGTPLALQGTTEGSDFTGHLLAFVVEKFLEGFLAGEFQLIFGDEEAVCHGEVGTPSPLFFGA